MRRLVGTGTRLAGARASRLRRSLRAIIGRVTTPATPASPVTANRRRFLSLGGLLTGAGTLGLPGSRPGGTRPRRDVAAPAGTAAPGQPLLAPIYPKDPRYLTMSMGFNRRWAGTPGYIQVVRSAAETITAVQRAYDAGRRITVRGGGHCYENFSAGNDGGVIIDLSGMQDVQAYPDG